MAKKIGIIVLLCFSLCVGGVSAFANEGHDETDTQTLIETQPPVSSVLFRQDGADIQQSTDEGKTWQSYSPIEETDYFTYDEFSAWIENETENIQINLKDFYYWYTQDQFIEVSDEVAEVFVSDARHEMAYQRRLSRHKAQYSLDCDDGIEYSACLHEPTPQELLERMELFIRLWNALNSLPEIQGRRIDAHIILGKSIKEIAEAEGVHEESVRQSIKRGLERMKKTF